MPRRSWKFHLSRFLGGAIVVLLAGLLSGHLVATSVTALAVYTCWQIYNIRKLHQWLDNSDLEPPESLGIWSDVFDRINQIQKQNIVNREQQIATIREFQSVTNAFPDASLVIDHNDAITWFNDAAEQLLGLKEAEDLGQPVTNLIRGPDFANWLAVQSQVSSKLEIPCPRDANIFLSLSAIAYREGQRLVILRDISDIHNLERIRRDFVANVSHELRTPLTVLFGYLETIGDQCSKELKPVIRKMQRQAEQMRALLNDLLELSRLQSDEHETSDEDINVPAMLALLKEQAEELSVGKHTLIFEIQPDVWLRGIPSDIESVFRNLIQNAIHYTPEGGSITVQWQARNSRPVFSVTDTGTGIPKRDIPRLTERFYRVGSDRSRETGGTGLGLSIVKHVLNAHQANLKIESTLGEGSCFTCSFTNERLLNQA